MTIAQSKPLLWAPANLAGTPVTPSATAWANSGWVEILASADATSQVDSIVLHSKGTETRIEWEIDLATGASGSESVKATMRGTFLVAANSSTSGSGHTQRFPLMASILPSGARLSARLRKSGAATTPMNISVGYVEGTESSQTTNRVFKAFPSAANGVSCAPAATAWSNGPWVDLTDALPKIDIQGLVHVSGATTAKGTNYEIDIATGASGSETTIATVRAGLRSTAAYGTTAFNFHGAVQVPAATRIATRVRTSGTDTSPFAVALIYTEVPPPLFATPTNRFFPMFAV